MQACPALKEISLKQREHLVQLFQATVRSKGTRAKADYMSMSVRRPVLFAADLLECMCLLIALI